MNSKTPNFHKALDQILKDLKPHVKKCSQCERDFEIFQEDIDFYHKLHVPPPKLCPDCRKQRRMVFSNNTTFYKKQCDAPGHSEDVISLFSDELDQKVYDHQYWWSDVWDPMSFSKEYDFSKQFFAQFHDFYRNFPLIQTSRDPKSVGSDYTAYGMELKNCYYVFGGINSENILYGNWPIYARDCIDIWVAYKSELCYEIVSGSDNYNCNFLYFSNNCLDSSFLYDCRNCSSCFGSANLRNKKYYFFNEPLAKEEYEQKMTEVYLGSRKSFIFWKDKFIKSLENKVRRATRNEKSQNSLGTFLRECRDCFMGFWVENGENMRYVDYGLSAKDAMDMTLVGSSMRTELVYESVNISTYSIKFSHMTRNSNFLEYCINCYNCENCFGCVGLRNKKYCIFNKQYTEEEYWKTLDEIKTKMLQDGEYGEFFPISISPYPYNASLAQFEFPLIKEGAKRMGAYWAEQEVSLEGIDRETILKADEVPDDIKEVNDDILNKVIICEVTGKPFRIIKEELEFYRRKNLPLPIKHPYQRIMERWVMKEPFRLWKYTCSNCGKEMYTSCDPARKLKVFCEECYLKEVV